MVRANKSNLIPGAVNLVLGSGNLNLSAASVFKHIVHTKVVIIAPHT